MGKVDEGRGWAWVLLLVGGGVSIAANLGHAWLRPEGAPEGWGPGRWAIAWAVIVPTLLFLAVKGLTIIPWPRGARWVMWRFLGALPVTGLAAYVSWGHIGELLASIGENPIVCALAPLAIDGMMLIGVGGLMATQGRTLRTTTPPSSPVDTGRLFNGTGSGLYASSGRR